MLCPNCGVDVGDKIGLCPKCAAARGATGGAGLGLTPAPTAPPESPEEPRTGRPTGKNELVPPAALPLDPGGFWPRFFALLLDLCILRTLFFGVEILLAAVSPALIERYTAFFLPHLLELGNQLQLGGQYGFWIAALFLPIIAVVLAWMILLFVLLIFYSSALECSPLQGTIGKLAFGLIVTTPDDRRISLPRACGRALLKLLSAAPFCLGFLIALSNWERCTVHDVLSGTRVRETYRISTFKRLLAGFATILFCVVLALATQIRMGSGASGQSPGPGTEEAGLPSTGARPLIERDEIGFVTFGADRFPIQSLVAHVDVKSSILRIGMYGTPIDPIIAGKLEEARSLTAVPDHQPTAVLELRFSRGTRYCTPESLSVFLIRLLPGGPIPLPPETPQLEVVRAGGRLVFDAFRELTCAFESGSLLNITFQDDATVELGGSKGSISIFFRGKTRLVVTG